jgi:hypothetical protein
MENASKASIHQRAEGIPSGKYTGSDPIFAAFLQSFEILLNMSKER